MISGSEGTDELFQLKVNLETGEAHEDTLPQDGVFHFDDEEQNNNMTDGEREALLSQYNMDRQAGTWPSQLKQVPIKCGVLCVHAGVFIIMCHLPFAV